MSVPAEPIKVLCVEDNQFVADAIARKLQSHAGFEWLGTVSTLDDLLAKVETVQPDVVCMDYSLPGQDPYLMMKMLDQKCPSARVLMLTGHVSHDLIERAIAEGAWGYLSKAEDSRTIFESIGRVAGGEFVLGEIARQQFRGTVPATGKRGAPSQDGAAPRSTKVRSLRDLFRPSTEEWAS